MNIKNMKINPFFVTFSLNFTYNQIKKTKIMRAITNITIQYNTQKQNSVTMFQTYNNNPNDYGHNNYNSIDDALKSLSEIQDPTYFPIKTKTYRLIIHNNDLKVFDQHLPLNIFN
jgi:hypothetical protein